MSREEHKDGNPHNDRVDGSGFMMNNQDGVGQKPQGGLSL
jgi:hypothetical protein